MEPEERAGLAIDGDDDDEGFGVIVSDVWWRAALLPWDGGCGCVGLGPCRLRDLYQEATSPCGGSDAVGVGSAYVGAAAFPHSSYERRAGTNFGAPVRRLEASNPAEEDSVCQGSGASSDTGPVCSVSAWASYSARM